MGVIYETPADRASQAAFKHRIEKRTHSILLSLPYEMRLDYIAVRGQKGVAWIECKKRSHKYGAYTTVYLSVSKIEKAQKYQSMFGLFDSCEEIPFIFAVEFEDGDYLTTIWKPERWNRRVIQAKDTEGRVREPDEVVEIPICEFKKWRP